MYNSDTPLRAELPSSRQLLRSTILAAIAALVLLVAVVLPAEYGIDHTGIGRVLRMTEMGEIKLKMAQGAKAQYAWVVEGGAVNFDTHGDAPGKSISYEKGRGVSSDEGVLEAAFTGNHGWYWRNRGQSNVKVTLRTRGDYTEIKRMK